MIKKTLLYLGLILLCQLSIGQEQYTSYTIPEKLKETANAVVRTHDTKIEVLSLNNMVITKRRVVTVLNRFGDRYVNAIESYDDSRSILKLSLIVLDSSGKVIKKYRKKDFKDESAVSNGQMYMDNRIKIIEYSPMSYPYTIVFESTVKEKSTAFLNNWYPLEGYYVSVENSSYKLINQTESKYKFKGYNTKDYDFELQNNDKQLIYIAKDLKAVEKEELSPDFLTIMPWVRFALNEFELKGVRGKGSDWNEFGLWQYQDLLKGRDHIDDLTKNKITKLIVGASTKKEKVKRIYNYVQDNTRYVGIQLGIGGWQPIRAEDVDRVKYGDCKGLTNYTKALLKTQGIESYYSVVFSGNTKRNLDKSFSSMQGNHVFLKVPLEEEDIWLECTSQTIPFGFLGSFTDDRDVLVVTPEGGFIEHTPIYSASNNKIIKSSNVKINDIGDLNAKIKIESHGLQYNNRSGLNSLSAQKQKGHYKEEWSYLNGIEINSISNKKIKKIFY